MALLSCCAAADSKAEEFAMPEYELFYWPITGLAEPIRMCFLLGGVPFKDSTPKTCEDFMAQKEAANQQVPFLKVDGKAMPQSRAILRYLGREMKYDGKPLYPEDSLAAYWCDELIELMEDTRSPIGATFAISDQAEKEAARAALVAEDGKITKMMVKLDARLATFGPDLTIGDLYVFCVCNMFRTPTFIDGIPEGTLDKYENLTKHHEWIANLPPVLEFYKETDEIRKSFQPLKK